MKPVLNRRIGILGGGQLGKMLIESYSSLNLNYSVLEKDANCPAGLVCKSIIPGSLYDEDAIKLIAEKVDILSYEIEHVNVDALKNLEKNTRIIPYPSVLEIVQDKGLQKDFYYQSGVSTLAYHLCTSENLAKEVEKLKEDRFVLKHRKGGYDGKGVHILSKSEFKSLAENNDECLRNDSGYVIEKWLGQAREFSVIVCVDIEGKIKTYPPCEMVFDPRANLMDYLISPAPLDPMQIDEACKLAIKAVKGFNSPGIFAVELLMDKEHCLYVNEIAPRPHNSGHHSIESCITSQYEQLNRILLGLPLGDTTQLLPALCVNIVGPEDVDGEYFIEGLDKLFSINGLYLHLYGKTISKPFRKLGHYTLLGQSIEDCIKKMNQVRECFSIKAKP